MTKVEKIAAPTHSPVQRDVRVMLVDDSLVVRSILERIIGDQDGLTICKSVASADAALTYLSREPVDVVVLDIEMPGMSGIDALPHIMERAENARVLILSSNCEDGGPAAIEALAQGASDTLAKPGKGSFSGRFAQVLIERILILGHKHSTFAERTVPPPKPVVPAPPVAMEWDTRLACIGIAASTGGIPAFGSFLANLDPRISAPIFLTQHLPEAFVGYYAKQIAMASHRTVCVAEAGMAVKPDHIYLAPGNAHMVLVKSGRRVEIALDRHVMDNGCCPSADPMLASIADVYGDRSVGIMLSGMGRDGADGAARLKASGGRVFAQAPESCVVWGMPGAVAKTGIAMATLNPDAIAMLLNGMISKQRAKR